MANRGRYVFRRFCTWVEKRVHRIPATLSRSEPLNDRTGRERIEMIESSVRISSIAGTRIRELQFCTIAASTYSDSCRAYRPLFENRNLKRRRGLEP